MTVSGKFISRRVFSLLLAPVLIVTLIAITAATALASDVPWTGNGTNGGFCNDNRQDGSVPEGMQAWLFILTSPDAGPWTLTATFNPGGTITVNGDQRGNGSVHFHVMTPLDAQLLSAVATGGSGGSNLVVSHCDSNSPTPAVLEVSKDAHTSYTRTYTWDIVKTANPSVLDLFANDSGTVDYTVAVTQTGFVDSDWAVSGTITIHNPSSVDATIASVTDEISGVGSVPVNCPGTVVPAGGTMHCSYAAALPDGSPRTNVATVTTTGSVAGASGEAAVTFGTPSAEVNATINVSDSMAGSLGSFNGSGSTSYSRTFTCREDAGTHENVAVLEQTGQSASASVQVNCYELVVSKTAVATNGGGVSWNVEKSVDPADLDLFVGDSGDVTYTVVVTRGGSGETGWVVTGEIMVQNPSPITANLSGVFDIVEPDIIATVNCPALTIAPSSTLVCTYSAPLPDDSPRVNTATATLQNTPGGTTDFSGWEHVSFEPGSGGGGDEEVDVIDSLVGYLGTVSTDETFVYPYTFTCGQTSSIPNTVDLFGAGGVIDSATAFVDLRCHALEVSKTADVSFDRAWDWTIEKSADQSNLTLAEGASAVVNYTVSVDATATDSGWSVAGSITIHNPSPLIANLDRVTDMISPDIALEVECPTLTIEPQSSVVCTYWSDLPDGETRTNTATAVLINSPSGTTDFTGSADVAFGAPANETDECVDLSDTLVGGLGTVCAGDGLPHPVHYPYTAGPYPSCGQQAPIVNTAAFVTTDTGATGDDSVTIPVSVECDEPEAPQGCTPGYWKNHDDNWGPTGYAPSQSISSVFSAAPAPFAGKSLLQGLKLKGGSGINGARETLLRAAVAAVLNASDPRLTYPLSAADVIAEVNAVIAGSDRAAIIALAGALDDYNNSGCPLN